jgi:hypothetical protein
MWPFRRFKGMIRPNMALCFEGGRRIAARKSVFMVEYLRARRDPDRRCIRLYREWHLNAMARGTVIIIGLYGLGKGR